MKTRSLKHLLIAVHFTAAGLKCDTSGCNYIDGSVRELTDKVIAQNLNRPCPKCGGNLLTKADAKTTRITRKLVTAFNVVAFPFMLLFLPVNLIRGMNIVKARGHMNGTGTIRFDSEGGE